MDKDLKMDNEILSRGSLFLEDVANKTKVCFYYIKVTSVEALTIKNTVLIELKIIRCQYHITYYN